MAGQRRLRGKKLLVASMGTGALTLVFCGLMPGCNLMSPDCNKEPTRCFPDDFSVVDHSAAADDLSKKD